MKTIITALALLAALPAQAGDLYLDINGLSWHSKNTYSYRDQRETYNSQNIGAGLTYGFHKYVEAFGGYYRNSFNRDTVYLGAKVKRDFTFGNVVITPGLNVGVATGYENTAAQSGYLQVVAMPSVRATYRGVGLTVGYIPRVEKDNLVSISVITAQINVRIGRF